METHEVMDIEDQLDKAIDDVIDETNKHVEKYHYGNGMKKGLEIAKGLIQKKRKQKGRTDHSSAPFDIIGCHSFQRDSALCVDCASSSYKDNCPALSIILKNPPKESDADTACSAYRKGSRQGCDTCYAHVAPRLDCYKPKVVGCTKGDASVRCYECAGADFRDPCDEFHPIYMKLKETSDEQCPVFSKCENTAKGAQCHMGWHSQCPPEWLGCYQPKETSND